VGLHVPLRGKALKPAAPPFAPALDPARVVLGDWWKDEDLPVAWDRILPGGPLHLEVGFGGGEFLLRRALADPGGRYVGVDHFAEGHRRLLQAAGERGLSNVLSAVGDAFVAVNLLFADGSLESCTVNFPDPWPKARHARRRLFQEEFFRIAARKLRPGGRLYLATDDRPYALQAAEEWPKVPLLESTHPEVPWLEASPHPFTTRYEERWRAQGRPLHYFVLARRRDAPREV